MIIKEIKLGMTIELSDGWNIYSVVEELDRFVKLKCITFVRREDLGDLIFCNKEGEEIWIAKFHSTFFDESTWKDDHD